MKSIIPVNADDDEVVDGIIVSTLHPETLHIIYLCLDAALCLLWLWIMYILICHRIFPLFGFPVLLLRSAWHSRAQKAQKELGIDEDGKPARRKKRNPHQ